MGDSEGCGGVRLSGGRRGGGSEMLKKLFCVARLEYDIVREDPVNPVGCNGASFTCGRTREGSGGSGTSEMISGLLT
jgi:hypothetical protein